MCAEYAGGGLDIQSSQWNVPVAFSAWGAGGVQTVDVTVAVDAARSFAVPQALANQTGYGVDFYGGSVWLASATVLRGTLHSIAAIAGFSMYAAVHTLRKVPRVMQVVAGGSSPVTIPAVDTSRKLFIIPLTWAGVLDAGSPTFFSLLSATSVGAPTFSGSANCRALILQP